MSHQCIPMKWMGFDLSVDRWRWSASTVRLMLMSHFLENVIGQPLLFPCLPSECMNIMTAHHSISRCTCHSLNNFIIPGVACFFPLYLYIFLSHCLFISVGGSWAWLLWNPVSRLVWSCWWMPSSSLAKPPWGFSCWRRWPLIKYVDIQENQRLLTGCEQRKGSSTMY